MTTRAFFVPDPPLQLTSPLTAFGGPAHFSLQAFKLGTSWPRTAKHRRCSPATSSLFSPSAPTGASRLPTTIPGPALRRC
jgi:hypothetical protein